MPIQTFWSEPNGRSRRWLRRYSADHPSPPNGDYTNFWTCERGWHAAMARIEDIEGEETSGDLWPHDDPRWPTHCEKGCGYAFVDGDHWQLFTHHEYRAAAAAGTIAVGDTFTLFDAPPGAMWDAYWMGQSWRGPDGIDLVVILPNGNQWTVDGRASNCTLPDDDVHKCWVRHGDPRTQPVTVDKRGVTCQAGAGSILSGDYHGFLQNGFLT